MDSQFQPRHYLDYIAQPIELTSRKRLLTEPEAVFEIGQSFDGLPTALAVSRSVNVRDPVLGALRRPQQLPVSIQTALVHLETAVKQHTIAVGIHSIFQRKFYETNKKIPALLGDTLLTKILGNISPMVLPEDRPAYPIQSQERQENSVLLNFRDLTQVASGKPETVPAVQQTQTPNGSAVATFGRDTSVFVSLDDQEILAVPFSSNNNGLQNARVIVWESLLGLPSTKYAFRSSVDGSIEEGLLSNQVRYRWALQQASAIGWWVSKADVAELLCRLAISVDQKWHSHKRVHCDLKPGNVLVTPSGIEAFDSMEVAEGETSIGMTAGWAAPEQVIGKAITPATDVFALALMMISLLGGAIYGEERSIIIPTQGEGRKRVRLLADPEVWLDPTVIALPTEARVAWRDVLISCLTMNTKQRLSRGSIFAEKVTNLLSRWPLPGYVSVPSGPGSLQKVKGITDKWVWVVSDIR